MEKYTIKPLEWKHYASGWTEADLFFKHQYAVRLMQNGWLWGYCDMDNQWTNGDCCTSSEDAMRLAEAHWRETITTMLDEVKE